MVGGGRGGGKEQTHFSPTARQKSAATRGKMMVREGRLVLL